VNLLDKKCGAWAAMVLRISAAHLLPAAGAAAVASLLVASPAHAQGSAVLTGTILDTATKRPIPDVVVTATSPALQGEQTVVTDKSGSYRIPNLPPGDYSLRLEGDSYKPYSRGGINLRVDSTIRVNAELLPEGIKAEEVVVVGKAPTVDVGSSSTGVTLNQEFMSRVALAPPGGKGAGYNSFESLATVAPGAQSDLYGVSIAGTTSPENGFVVDGVSVSDPAFGILGTPLSSEFIKEANVITGGYLPEYGKSIGGIYDVVTKGGSNEFHGSVFFNVTPGGLNGPVKTVTTVGSSEALTNSVSALRDFGADIGGPIVKDKLWFYVGIQAAYSTWDMQRNLSSFNYMPDTANDGHTAGTVVPTNNASGLQTSNVFSSKTYLATQQQFQYIGKLEYLINQDHHLTLSVYGTPTTSGGNGNYGFGTQTNAPPGDLNGTYSALGNQTVAFSNDVSLKYSGAFNNKRQLLDVTVGWHHQHQATNGGDGSTVFQTTNPSVVAGQPGVYYRAQHAISYFEPVPKGACTTVNVWTPAAGGTPGFSTPTSTCPQTTYFAGGPGFIDDVLLDSYQGKAVFTDLLQLGGHHVIKAGVDFKYDSYTHNKGYSGGDFYQENSTGGAIVGGSFNDNRNYGFLTAPDQAVLLSHYTARTTTTSIGGFLQDSWSIFDKVTLNFGVRYDAQIIYGADGSLGLTLPNQWSPRVGIVYDFTQQGRSKLFANYARYYEGIPLDMADRSFPSEPQATSNHVGADSNGNVVCNPTNPTAVAPGGGCTTNAGRIPSPQQYANSAATAPSQIWQRVGASKEPVDPDLSPQSSDEYVVGGEYEVFQDARLTVSYTHREMHRAVEDMSRDEANTYFIGNPGYGIASDFPKAVRNYDAMTIAFTKAYGDTWLLTASYVLSRLYGNYSGLFVPETGQLDPNITADFDLKSLLPNQLGPLPGDHTHQFKIFAAKDWLLPAAQDILTGLTFRARSGQPLNALGAHPIYGPSNVYIVPRGEGGMLTTTNPSSPNYGEVTSQRGPWNNSIDLRLGYSVKLAKATTLALTMDIYNIFDFQAATAQDPNYTFASVLPCLTGTAPSCLKQSNGAAFNARTMLNPNYGQPTAYQDPRQWRFGAKVTF
jgi:outer membrane receptor protein involved in Fe transport